MKVEYPWRPYVCFGLDNIALITSGKMSMEGGYDDRERLVLEEGKTNKMTRGGGRRSDRVRMGEGGSS